MKKYLLILFIGLLLIPIILNFVLQIPSRFPIIGDSQAWLSLGLLHRSYRIIRNDCYNTFNFKTKSSPTK